MKNREIIVDVHYTYCSETGEKILDIDLMQEDWSNQVNELINTPIK